jgi:hypothetical protein
MAFNGDWAGWELPWRWRGQSSVDWRGARQTHKTRRAWVFHTLEALKSTRTGERRCVDWRRGVLGAAIHEQRPKLRGSGAAGRDAYTPPSPFLPTYLT